MRKVNTIIIFMVVILHVCCGFEENNKYPIVFIHGIAAGFEKWEKLGKEIGKENYYEMRYMGNGKISDTYNESYSQGRQVWNISYYTEDIIAESFSGDLNIYSLRIEEMIDKIKTYSGSGKIIAVAHSMGGLILRNYMIRSEENNQSVYKFLTVATPNEGIDIAPPIVGQLKDLNSGSDFILNLKKKWKELKFTKERWGIVAAVDRVVAGFPIDENSTDSGGIGFVKISSSLPSGSYKLFVENIGKIMKNTEFSSYVVLVEDNHNDVLKNIEVKKAMEWVIE